MDVCKTDVRTIIKYLGDAAQLYDRQPRPTVCLPGAHVKTVNQ